MQTSLVSFVDFNGTPGSQRSRIPGRIRAMHEDPHRHPWDYYGPMVEAITSSYDDPHELASRVQLAVEQAQWRDGEMKTRGQLRHFRELADGILRLRTALPVTRRERAPRSTWSHGDLQVRVAPHLRVTRRDGHGELWFLYLKERPLQQGTADPALIILADAATELGLPVIGRVIDVRRAKTFTLHRNRPLGPLRAHLVSEAEQFARLWSLTAA